MESFLILCGRYSLYECLTIIFLLCQDKQNIIRFFSVGMSLLPNSKKNRFGTKAKAKTDKEIQSTFSEAFHVIFTKREIFWIFFLMASKSSSAFIRQKPSPPKPLEYYDNLKSIKCTCSSGKCLRLYCQCFFNETYCSSECNCSSSCQNSINMLNENKKKRELAYIKHQQISCSCRTAKCLKKYCECFKQNLKCTSACSCTDCENMEEYEGYHDDEHEPQEFFTSCGSLF